jgi:hypothetical protein
MAFPHPQSRKDNYRNGDKSNNGGVIWKFFKRTISISDDRNAENEVNPTKNRTLGALVHDVGTPNGVAYPGGGLSPVLCEYNEEVATVRTPARDKNTIHSRLRRVHSASSPPSVVFDLVIVSEFVVVVRPLHIHQVVP